MKITDKLHMVASGASGFDLTDSLDCNIFLFTDGVEHLIFDSGAGRDIDGLFAEMRADGLDPSGIRTLFLTHGHADHSGGAAGLAARIPGLKIVAGRKTADILAADDERLVSLDRVRGKVYPLDYRWRAPQVGHVLHAGERWRAGAFEVTLHETPGHSDDHCCYIVEADGLSSLVAGDALFAGGKVILQDIEDCSVSKTLASIRKLAQLDFERFLPGHGRFSLRNGKRHVDAAMPYVEAGAPPPQL
jgi:glyoxylase-like metal-dependent hydrolase (beta-lactamase superfamily II)